MAPPTYLASFSCRHSVRGVEPGDEAAPYLGQLPEMKHAWCLFFLSCLWSSKGRLKGVGMRRGMLWHLWLVPNTVRRKMNI